MAFLPERPDARYPIVSPEHTGKKRMKFTGASNKGARDYPGL